MSARTGKATTTIPDSDKPITKEERTLLQSYRELARWDQTFVFLILQSLAWGKHSDTTDKYSWDKICSISNLPRRRKAAA